MNLITGCTLLGLRTPLDKLPVTTLTASLLHKTTLSPGESGHLVLTATTRDGKQFVSVGAGRGTVPFDNFKFDAHVIDVSDKGVVTLPADPRVSEGMTPLIHITVISHPEVVADLDIPISYNAAFVANFSGKAGVNGFDGLNGLDGMSGADGAIGTVGAHGSTTAGGNGSNGLSGGDGSNGGNGQPGHHVHVWVTLKPDAQQLLEVRVSSTDHEEFFLIDTSGGELTVNANGGRGGSGGKGGTGGKGGRGGNPGGVSGLDGHNGSDGQSGKNGAAGSIIVSADPQVTPYLNRLHFNNKSGAGVNGPKPDIRIEPVAAIW